MKRRRFKFFKWLSYIILALVIFIGAVFVFFTIVPNRIFDKLSSELEQSKTLWEKQDIQNYHFLIRYSFSATCDEEIFVRDGKATVISSNCKHNDQPPKTVPEMFAIIEAFIEARKCGHNGCGCDGPVIPSVVYDQEFGFPKEVKIDIQPERSWLYKEYWLSYRAPCTLLGFGAPAFEIKDFETTNVTR